MKPQWVWEFPLAKETLLIVLFGHTPHLDCFPLVVPISSLCLVFWLVLQIAQIRVHKNSFGKVFGNYVFLKRSIILFGRLVTMRCQQWLICFTGRLPPWLPANSIKIVLKIHCTLSSFARKWKVHGVCSSASTKWTFLLQQISMS